ncbi:MAG: porin family protein [Xanthobacteraceae bacterium]
MKKLLLAAVALAALAAGPAVAADLGRKAPAYIPPPAPPPPTFTGCYVNGGAGYGLWNIDHSFQDTSGALNTVETTSGGRGWLGRFGGGCDYQFGGGTGFWSNWVVGAFADYDTMDLHKNFESSIGGFAGEEKEKDAWAVGGRIGYLVTPNVFTYWNGGYTETRFDGINLSGTIDGDPFGSIGSHTYHGWFVGGGYEIGLSGFFGWQLPSGLFWRTEYRYSSFNSADLPVLDTSGVQIGNEHMRPFVQTITTSLVYKFNWWGH